MFAYHTALEIYLVVVLGLAALASLASLGTLVWLVADRAPRSSVQPHTPVSTPPAPRARLSNHRSLSAHAR
jgi:hypothetical protein